MSPDSAARNLPARPIITPAAASNVPAAAPVTAVRAPAVALPAPVPRIDRLVVIQIFGLYLASRLLIYVVSALSHTAVAPGLFETNGKTWTERFLVWDTGWYMGIVRDGYFYDPNNSSSVAFYPLYPMLIRAIGWLHVDQNLAGYAISNLCLIGACFLIWRLAARETRSASIAFRTVVFVLFCPGAMWFGMVYTESLYLLTVVGCLLSARNGQWIRAGIWGFASALTRTPGLFLAGFIFLEAMQHLWDLRRAKQAGVPITAIDGFTSAAADLNAEDKDAPTLTRLPWLLRAALGTLGPILGYLSYVTFLQIRFGDWQAQQKTMAKGWGGHMQLPWNALIEQWQRNDSIQMLISTPFLGIVLLLAGVGLWTLKRVGYAVFVWALAILYVSATPGDSVTRYLCTSAPVFIVAAQLAEKSKLLETTILVFSTAIMVLITMLLANGYRMI